MVSKPNNDRSHKTDKSKKTSEGSLSRSGRFWIPIINHQSCSFLKPIGSNIAMAAYMGWTRERTATGERLIVTQGQSESLRNELPEIKSPAVGWYPIHRKILSLVSFTINSRTDNLHSRWEFHLSNEYRVKKFKPNWILLF